MAMLDMGAMMIIKLTDIVPNQTQYVRKTRVLKAVEMREDFLLETWLGWIQGRKGDWLVEICNTLRFPVSPSAFLKEYSLYDPKTVCSLCDGNPGNAGKTV